MLQKNLGVVGTAGARRGWRPAEYKAITENQYNCVHVLNDKDNFRIVWLVDNNIVTMVTTVHTGKEHVSCVHKCPCITNTKRSFISTVWDK